MKLELLVNVLALLSIALPILLERLKKRSCLNDSLLTLLRVREELEERLKTERAKLTAPDVHAEQDRVVRELEAIEEQLAKDLNQRLETPHPTQNFYPIGIAVITGALYVFIDPVLRQLMPHVKEGIMTRADGQLGITAVIVSISVLVNRAAFQRLSRGRRWGYLRHNLIALGLFLCCSLVVGLVALSFLSAIDPHTRLW